MSATSVVVEVLIGGLQAPVWLYLLSVSALGPYPVDLSWVGSVQNIVLALLIGFAYPLGILVDRVADTILHRWIEGFKREAFTRHEQDPRVLPFASNRSTGLHQMRFRIQSKSPDAWKGIEYTSSRARVARATAFNAVMLLVAAALVLAKPEIRGNDHWRAAMEIAAGAAVLFGVFAVYAWQHLDRQYYTLLVEGYLAYTDLPTEDLKRG